MSSLPKYLKPTTRRFAGNVGWLVANRVLRILAGIVVLGAIGRYLGPEAFGTLNYAIGLATIFASVANLGFEGIIIRDLIREPEKTGAILGTACGLRVVAGIVAIVTVAGAAWLAEDPQVLTLATVVALAYLPGAADVIELWFQKNVDARSTFHVRGAAVLLISGFRVLLIWIGAPLEAFAWTQLLEALLGAVGLATVFQRRGGSLAAWRWVPSLACRILRDCWPLALSGTLIALYARVEQILVKEVLGDFVLGIYYAAVRISEVWIFLPSVVVTTIYPALVAKRAGGSASTASQHQQMLFDALTALGYLVALGATFAAPILVPLIFGSKYQAAVPVLIIQAWTAPILFNGAARAQYFLLENLVRYHTISAIAGIAANVIFGLLLMKFFGASGAALAALLAACISAYGTSLAIPRLRPCFSLQSRAFLIPFRIPSFLKSVKANL